MPVSMYQKNTGQKKNLKNRIYTKDHSHQGGGPLWFQWIQLISTKQTYYDSRHFLKNIEKFVQNGAARNGYRLEEVKNFSIFKQREFLYGEIRQENNFSFSYILCPTALLRPQACPGATVTGGFRPLEKSAHREILNRLLAITNFEKYAGTTRRHQSSYGIDRFF